MKKPLTFLIGYFLFIGTITSQGVAIAKIDSAHNSFTAFLLKSSSTSATINNQISTTTTTQLFINTTQDSTGFKYGFPMPEKAAATRIRWNYTGQWQTASLIATPQDSTFHTDSNAVTIYTPALLDTFLGSSPLYFPVDISMAPGDSIFIELTYVELLPYQNNYVSFAYPGRYNLIQPNIASLDFVINVASYRVIDSLLPKSYAGWQLAINGNTATASLALTNNSFSSAVKLDYLLHPDSAGFFSFSTFYPDSIEMCDTTNGFFTFIVEPNSADQTDVIEKDFVLIIDNSGSMSGTKMTQANQAAEFIVNNLNSGDRFDIVKFNTTASSLSGQFLNYNLTTQQQAQNYIAGITAGGGTNISGAFDAAVPIFSTSNSTRAKIIIFFTDGQAGSGITNDAQLIAHVTNLIQTTSPDISLYTFGIGSSVNTYLLTQLAVQNNGTCDFLANNNVSTAISNFYLTIQSPVLLGTTITFSPAVVSEIYPNPLPNLYKGQQLIVSGRYTAPGPINVTLSGTAFGNPVSYPYVMNLTDSLIEENSFLPKVWAKSKIDYLLTQYYINQSNTNVANQIHRQIADLSLCRGIISPFTSFTGTSGGGTVLEIDETTDDKIKLLRVYPNPTTDVSYVSIPKPYSQMGRARISIYSLDGRIISEYDSGIETDETVRISSGELQLGPGVYLILLSIGEKQFRVKLSVI